MYDTPHIKIRHDLFIIIAHSSFKGYVCGLIKMTKANLGIIIIVLISSSMWQFITKKPVDPEARKNWSTSRQYTVIIN